MATITATDMTGSGDRAVTETTLTSDDTLTYNASRNPQLVIRNDSGSAVTPNIVGDEATTAQVEGIGEVDVSEGFDFDEIADGDVVALPLRTVAKYLAGTISLTGADGATAQLLEF